MSVFIGLLGIISGMFFLAALVQAFIAVVMYILNVTIKIVRSDGKVLLQSMKAYTITAVVCFTVSVILFALAMFLV